VTKKTQIQLFWNIVFY